MILGWFGGHILEISKWWRKDKQTDRSSTWRLDPWNRYMAPSALPQAWFSPKFQKSTIDQAVLYFWYKDPHDNVAGYQTCKYTNTNTNTSTQIHKYSLGEICRETQHMLYFLKALGMTTTNTMVMGLSHTLRSIQFKWMSHAVWVWPPAS